MDSTTRDRVFIAHSHQDAAWVERLKIHLKALKLDVWDDRRLRAEGDLPLRGALVQARVAVLLVSQSFLTSAFVAKHRLQSLLDAENGLTVAVIPIRPGDFAAILAPGHVVMLNLWNAMFHRGEEVHWNEETMALQLCAVAWRIASIGNALEALPPWLDELMEGARGERGPPPKRPQPVHLGASAPRVVRPGQEFTARFAAYHPAFARAVKHHLRGVGPRVKPHLGLATVLWRKGTQVTVRLSGDGLEVSPPSQEFVWQGPQHALDFDVRAVKHALDQVTRLKFDVCIDDLVLARLRLDVVVRKAWRVRLPWLRGPRCAFAEAPTTAFASYAWEDRPRVLDRVAAIRIATGLDVFLDCLSLRPNQQWQARLEKEISGRDVFMLFWSEWAAASRWVEWEWRHALRQKGLEAIQTHPLDPWPKAPLPQELSSLYLGDSLMAVREAALQVSPSPTPAATAPPPALPPAEPKR